MASRFQSLETISDLRNFESVYNCNSRSAPQALRETVFPTRVSTEICFCCSGGHLVNICPKFLNLSPEQRFLIVKQNNLCVNCFAFGHNLTEFRQNFNCVIWNLRHHTLLHRKVSGYSQELQGLDAIGSSRVAKLNSDVLNCFATTSGQILVGRAIVGICHQGQMFTARAQILYISI